MIISTHGYSLVYDPSRLKSYRNGYTYFHRVVAENVLCKKLPEKSEIHHIDGNCLNNKNDNLVICEDRAYHFLLHKRASAIKECGNPNWVRCIYCKQYHDPKNMYLYKSSRNIGQGYHRKCRNRYLKQYKKMKGEL